MDALISLWSDGSEHERYLMGARSARIANSTSFSFLPAKERLIAEALSRKLNPDQFARLPEMIATRRLEQAAKAADVPMEQRLATQRADEAERDARKREAVASKERVLAAQRADQVRREELQKLEAAAREREATARRERARPFLERLKALLASDFLSAEVAFASIENDGLVTREDFDQLIAAFVVNWAEGELKEPLDPDQAAAVAATNGHVLVVARAGSGKTRTIVTRAIFLQKHCGVRPSEILLLAFNQRAAAEMKERLAKALGETLPHVMTFHALAHALVHPEEDLIYDDAASDQMGLSREVQVVIDEHLTSPDHRDQIRDLMLDSFRTDWEHIVEGRFALSMEDFLDYRRSLQRESLNGEFVKSYGERVIANALFEHGVAYRYERNFHWDDTNYRPDFTIDGPSPVVIEYFGLAGDPDYDEMSGHKRQFWASREEFAFLEFTPRDLLSDGVESFVAELLRRLAELGVPIARRSEEEIWELVKRRAIDGFTGAVKGFVGRGRKLNLDAGRLHKLIEHHTPSSPSESLFLEVAMSVYAGYLKRLETTHQEDFDGLIWRAVGLVRDGKTRFIRDKGRERGDVSRLRFVLIDEYQDFSQGFDHLIEALRGVSPDIRLFCVGDDWQAINGFAGSDLDFFNRFADRIDDSSVHTIATNYRSTVAIVETGNALMQGHGEAARAHRIEDGEVWQSALDEFQPSPAEDERHEGDDITPAVLRIVWKVVRNGEKCVLLFRTNSVPWYVNYPKAPNRKRGLEAFVEHIRSFLPEEERDLVTASTVHRYKGLERHTVVIMDALQQRYPLIHRHWIFLRVFGDSVAEIAAQERRLLYVALTRAADSLFVITDSNQKSPFLEDIQSVRRLAVLDWERLAPPPPLDGARLEIRVFDAYEVRDQLKDLHYRWHAKGKYWGRLVPADGFSMSAITSQSWAAGNARIKVLDAQTGEVQFRHPERTKDSRPTRLVQH